MMFSLLPLAFAGSVFSEDWTWAFCSYALVIFLIAQTVFSTRRIRKVSRLDSSRHSRLWAFSFLTAVIVVIVVVATNATGLWFESGYTGYFIGLMWLLVSSGLTFVRILGLAFQDT